MTSGRGRVLFISSWRARKDVCDERMFKRKQVGRERVSHEVEEDNSRW